METGGTVKLITVAVATNTLVTDQRNGNTANQDTTAEAMKQTTGQDWHEAVITVHGYRVMSASAFSMTSGSKCLIGPGLTALLFIFLI